MKWPRLFKARSKSEKAVYGPYVDKLRMAFFKFWDMYDPYHSSLDDEEYKMNLHAWVDRLISGDAEAFEHFCTYSPMADNEVPTETDMEIADTFIYILAQSIRISAELGHPYPKYIRRKWPEIDRQFLDYVQRYNDAHPSKLSVQNHEKKSRSGLGRLMFWRK